MPLSPIVWDADIFGLFLDDKRGQSNDISQSFGNEKTENNARFILSSPAIVFVVVLVIKQLYLAETELKLKADQVV